MAAAQNIPVLLLVGGMGTRLRSVVPNAPKPLATVGDKSFLELLVLQLREQGFRQLVMCSGYLADQIENHFGDGSRWDVSIEYSKESQPLGTGGAVKLAEPLLRGCSTFVVMNGDSFMESNFEELLRNHSAQKALLTMAVRRVENAGRYGTVQISPDQRITGFAEKTGSETPGIVNAGIYVFDSKILEEIAPGASSLERDLFPNILGRGVHAVEQKGMFIDIGTPEDYARAQQIFDRLFEAASLKQ